MRSGKLAGQRRSTSLDQMLFAYVQAFFMHIGAARDYLAAFAAAEIGRQERIDSTSRLVETLRSGDFQLSPILELMRSRGLFAPSPTKAGRWEVFGWLRELSDLRNKFVHKRPYGGKFVERSGYAQPVEPTRGIYRYFRPIIIGERSDVDLLDQLTAYYKNSIALFDDAAHASGHDLSILALTDKDIISIDIERRR